MKFKYTKFIDSTQKKSKKLNKVQASNNFSDSYNHLFEHAKLAWHLFKPVM